MATGDWPRWKGVNLRGKLFLEYVGVNREIDQENGIFEKCTCSTPPAEKELSPAGRVDVRFRKRQPFSPLCLNEGNIEGHTRPHGIYRPSCIIHRARAHTVARESRCRPGACPRRYAPSMTVARPVLHRPSHFAEKRGGAQIGRAPTPPIALPSR